MGCVILSQPILGGEKMLKVALIGAGQRGITYTNEMLKRQDRFQVIAVVEPIENRRETIREKHNIPETMCFKHFDDFFALGKVADLVIVAVQDNMHYEVAMKAISLGYHLLLEKPVAPTAKECYEIAENAKRMDVKVVVCHVLRYAPVFMKVKQLIHEGKLGNIISINHEECVGNVHQSHSYVRGNWGNEGRSSFMLLAKSCHDLDLLQWLLDKKAKKVQSFGSLTYFRKDNAPEGAPEHCLDGCPVGETCPYNAIKRYYDDKDNYFLRSTSTNCVEPTDEDVMRILKTTQYGKCVFKCDNDVVDHQTVNMLFEDDVTVTFTMNAFNKGGRFLHVMGTKGELRAAMDEKTPITLFEFETRNETVIPIVSKDGVDGGHGGGDAGIVEQLYDYMAGTYTGLSISDIETSVNNHLLVFAAEEARKNGTIVDFDEFLERF